MKGDEKVDKLKYDSFYKFLVSLGIILITLPFAGLIYIANFKVTLIDEEEYNNLSDYSVSSLEYKQRLYELLDKYFPKMIPVFLILGVIFLLLGGIPWFIMQRELDKQLRSDTKLKESDLKMRQMSFTEKYNKVKQEIEDEEAAEKLVENTEIDNNVDNKTNDNNEHQVAVDNSNEKEKTEPATAENKIDSIQNRMLKYIDIEEKVCEILTQRYSSQYTVLKNVKIGEGYFDAIAVSHESGPDIIFEIKKYIKPTYIYKSTIHSLYFAKEIYEEINNKKCKIVIIIVSPKKNIEVSSDVFNFRGSDINVEYWAEEDL